ncbi:hypothetical protein [uncultured Clostridium sp.]|jgi:hypothetical protein|uniref:hypothetical protein n=1 Tax=uncultured Clostridium sp. TaxID=59620 RepID=UPI002625E2D4|nr:hypothetical protein [uncultured Clostridium sp.]
MGNSSFSKRYLAEELLKILLIFISGGIIEYFCRVRGVSVSIIFISLFFTSHKLICVIQYLNKDKHHKMPSVGFMWRFKGRKGNRLSDIEIERRCAHEKNYNMAFLFLAGYGIISGTFDVIGVILIAYFIVYPKGYSFLDKNLGTYYKFRGECTGVITIENRNSKPSYYVSVVNYEKKQELVVDVSYEEMRDFRNGQIVDVVYGKFAKSAIIIY